eukprot:gene23459-29677_t
MAAAPGLLEGRQRGIEVTEAAVEVVAARQPGLAQIRLQLSQALGIVTEAVQIQIAERRRQMRPGQRELRIGLHRLAVMAASVEIVLITAEAQLVGQTAQISVVGSGIASSGLIERLGLGSGQAGVQRISDRLRDFAFDTEDAVQLAIVGFRPQMLVGIGADQLDIDPHRVAILLHATFQQMGDTETTGDPRQIARLAVDPGGGVARSHRQRAGGRRRLRRPDCPPPRPPR